MKAAKISCLAVGIIFLSIDYRRKEEKNRSELFTVNARADISWQIEDVRYKEP
jgi:hypothetical protein